MTWVLYASDACPLTQPALSKHWCKCSVTHCGVWLQPTCMNCVCRVCAEAKSVCITPYYYESDSLLRCTVSPATDTFMHRWNAAAPCCLYSPTVEHHHTLAGTHFPSSWGYEADLAWVAGHAPRWFVHPKMITHPSTNRARCRVTSLMCVI